MDEEELDGQGSLLEALRGGGSYGTEESHTYAKDILDRYQTDRDDDEDPEREIIAKMRERSNQTVAAIRATREKLRAQRYNPGELLLAASAALGAPTKTGTIGETISNTFGALQEPLARRRQFDRDREDREFELDQLEAGAGDDVLNAELQLGLLDRRLQSDMAGRALTTLSKPLRSAGSGGGSLTKQREIAHNYSRLLDTGLDENEAWDRAVKLAYDNIRLVFDPNLGTLREMDMITGRAREVPVDSPEFGGGPGPDGQPRRTARSPVDDEQAPIVEPPGPADGPEPQTIWDAAEHGTGWWSGLSQALNVAKGNLGMEINEDVADSRSVLYKSTAPMVRALSLNDQYPVREIERIREELDTLPSLSSNPPMLRRNLVTLRRYLDDALAKAEADWRDVSKPTALRSARGQLADAIRDFMPVLGVPQYELLEYNESLFMEPEDLPGFDQLSPAEQQELRERRERLLE